MDYVTRQFINLVKHFRNDLRKALSDLNSALHKQTEAIRKSHQGTNYEHRPSPEIIATVNLPKSIEVHQQANDARDERNYKRATFFVTALTFGALVVYADLVYLQYREMARATTATEHAADAAKTASDIARDALVLANRPWIKVRHRIVQPLTFNVVAWKGPIATMKIEDTIENVGQSVALNVFSWEDVSPLTYVNSMPSLQSAYKRQSEWCDANRHRKPGELSGYVLFPKDQPFVQEEGVGPFMEDVKKAMKTYPAEFQGKVEFLLVGCVVYRSSFEPPSAPAHETKFTYWLGEPQTQGGMLPLVEPIGTASNLRLIQMPDGFSAD
jgi:hypothetical protein